METFNLHAIQKGLPPAPPLAHVHVEIREGSQRGRKYLQKAAMTIGGSNQPLKIYLSAVSSSISESQAKKKGYIKVEVQDSNGTSREVLIKKKALEELTHNREIAQDSAHAQHFLDATGYLTSRGHSVDEVSVASQAGLLDYFVASERENDDIMAVYTKVLEARPLLRNDDKMKQQTLKCVHSWLTAVRSNPLQMVLGSGLPGEDLYLNKLILYHDTNKQVNVDVWKGQAEPMRGSKDFLGKGGFGIAQKLREISSTEYDRALKVALATKGASAVRDVFNEVRILFDVHKEGIHEGVQLPPHSVTPVNPPILDKNGNPLMGYIGPKYSGNLCGVTNLDTLSSKQKLEACRQLISGLAFVADEKQLYLGDIKPENIFFMTRTDGGIDCFLADMGGARYLSDIEPGEGGITTYTRGYYSKADLRADEKTSDDPERCFRAQTRRDVFALGCTLIEFLGGLAVQGDDRPEIFKKAHIRHKGMVPVPEGGFTDEGLGALNIIHQHYGKDVCNLLIAMVDSNPRARPKASECLNTLTQVISKIT